jgi:uncharacterized protein (TIGR02611 family)
MGWVRARRADPVLRYARKLLVGVVGTAVTLAGVALLVAPGPGILVILLGLAILSFEFPWATRLQRRLRVEARRAAAAARARRQARARTRVAKPGPPVRRPRVDKRPS